MSQHYSDPSRESDPYALPDVEVFELTAAEVAAGPDYEDERFELMKHGRFRFANMNSRDQAAMLDALVEQEGITGGWFWHSCFPGCLPDSEPNGPFKTRAEAIADSRSYLSELEPE